MITTTIKRTLNHFYNHPYQFLAFYAVDALVSCAIGFYLAKM